MNFNNTFPEWKNTGAEPSTELKNAGFLGGYKPPATVFNWFWSKVMKAITELQTKMSGLTKADVGLSNVDNTSDILKPVSMAMRSELDNKADAHNTQEGGQLGANSMALQGGAVGKNSYAGIGGAVGNNASATNGFAGGDGAVTQTGASVGDGSYSETGGAVGDGAKAGAGFSGGYNAEIGQTDQGYIDAIQLGTGLNQIVGSLQVYDYTLMDYFGKIPFARLPITVSAMQTYQFTSGYSAKVEYNFGSDTKFAIVKIGDCVKDDTQETVSVTATAMTGVIDPGPCIMFSRGAGVASDAALTVYYYVIEFK